MKSTTLDDLVTLSHFSASGSEAAVCEFEHAAAFYLDATAPIAKAKRMPAKVRFPDGEREVPSRTVTIESKQIGGGPPAYYEEPLPDPEWDFRPAIGGYVAVAKRGG